MTDVYRDKFILMVFVLSAMFAQISNDFRSLFCTECPANFTHVASVNGCYKVLNRNLEWSVAGLECRSLHRDAHLLVINNKQEQLAIAGLLASTSRQYFWFRAYVCCRVGRFTETISV